MRYSTLRSTSRQRGAPFLLTRTEFYEWYRKQPNRCHYCDLVDITLDDELSGNRQALTFTIDRKDSSQPYILSNMVFACWVCNRLKSNEFSHDEWMEIAQKYVKPKWKKKLELANAS